MECAVCENGIDFRKFPWSEVTVVMWAIVTIGQAPG